jgi:prefoldin subunit 5
MFDDEMMDVPCETCGKDVHVKMSELRKSPTLTCSCGQVIAVDASQLDSAMSNVDASIEDLDKAIGKLNKTIGG